MVCYRCARCNAAFALPQQVTRHVRDGQCGEHLSRRQTARTQGTTATSGPPAPAPATPQAPVQVDTNQPKSLACATCPYRSDSKAELLYHQFLHRGHVGKLEYCKLLRVTPYSTAPHRTPKQLYIDEFP